MFNIIINSSKVLPTTIFNENSFSQFQFQIHLGRVYILLRTPFFLSFEYSRQFEAQLLFSDAELKT